MCGFTYDQSQMQAMHTHGSLGSRLVHRCSICGTSGLLIVCVTCQDLPTALGCGRVLHDYCVAAFANAKLSPGDNLAGPGCRLTAADCNRWAADHEPAETIVDHDTVVDDAVD